MPTAIALGLLGCGPAARPAPPPHVIVHAPAVVAARPAPTLDERLERARADGVEGELAVEHREVLDGEARLHLVLEQGRCYRAWVGADTPARARLEDEHAHVLSEVEAGAWLGEVCPRWTGSFALVVTTDTPGRGSMAVLVRERAAE